LGLPPSSCSKTPAPLQVRAGGTVSQTAPALLKQAGGMLGLGAGAVGQRLSACCCLCRSAGQCWLGSPLARRGCRRPSRQVRKTGWRWPAVAESLPPAPAHTLAAHGGSAAPAGLVR
jgi:hypothetical protein